MVDEFLVVVPFVFLAFVSTGRRRRRGELEFGESTPVAATAVWVQTAWPTGLFGFAAEGFVVGVLAAGVLLRVDFEVSAVELVGGEGAEGGVGVGSGGCVGC